ncbi:MAG TPA: CDGSH iron-sulfur domain-containing protein [Pseudomonas sp.]|nr:CDGSH iron-sulfur domain-containing protein [Pseudomonas sp.]
MRQVQPGEALQLCTCGRSPRLPDCSPGCTEGLRLQVLRPQRLLLCRCGHSRQLPYCDGRHQPPAPGLKAKCRRFFGLDKP